MFNCLNKFSYYKLCDVVRGIKTSAFKTVFSSYFHSCFKYYNSFTAYFIKQGKLC